MGIVTKVKIPAVAESIQEVTVTQWLTRDGEIVNPKVPLCELESEKATFELFTQAAGFLRIIVPENQKVSIGTEIGQILTQKGITNNLNHNSNTVMNGTETPPTMTATGIHEMRVVPLGESITEVTIGTWLKQDGDYVELDESLCEVETDKATQELPSEAAGILRIVAQEGDVLKIGELICKIELVEGKPQTEAPTPVVAQTTPEATATSQPTSEQTYATSHPSPAAAKILSEKGITPQEVKGTGIDGRITKEDALKAEKAIKQIPTPTQTAPVKAVETTPESTDNRGEARKRLTPLRKTVARRLVAVKNETAMLTTFNEVNMQPIMDMRKKYKDMFKEKHQVNLGFMSFFVKAACEALLEVPEVNSMIDGEEMITYHYCDISVAVSAPKGLVVPIIRNAETMSFADIEKKIVELATKARDNKLSIPEMTGGTFTITNGGIFGSMMSTPIINAPQSAILGMHNIVDRAVVENGQIVIRPMMYLALSYDHRLIDGREAVTFLVKIKQRLEAPERMLFGV